MDFQINNETYFLDLSEDARQWLVLVETPTGARRIPVYVDEADAYELPVVVENNQPKMVN